MGYAVFLFCVWFLIIELVIWLVQKIQYHNYSKGVEQRNKQRQAEEWQQSLEFLWTDVDNLSSSDYKLLLRFIKNENQPYCSSGTPMGHCLLNSDWVHKTVSKPAKRVLIKSNQGLHQKQFLFRCMKQSQKHTSIFLEKIFIKCLNIHTKNTERFHISNKS